MCCAVSLWIRSVRMCTPMGQEHDDCHPLSHKVSPAYFKIKFNVTFICKARNNWSTKATISKTFYVSTVGASLMGRGSLFQSGLPLNRSQSIKGNLPVSLDRGMASRFWVDDLRDHFGMQEVRNIRSSC